MASSDVCIIGGGIVGLAVARELRKRLGRGARLIVLEKEKRTAEHGSGRNSGVLHAGFYYTANSLRARLCRDGNAQLTEFCEEHSVPLNKCGKLVVCKDETELSGLDELLRRARANGVELHKITAHEAREIEPRARTHLHAAWSPTTKSADTQRVADAMLREVRDSGIEVVTDAPFVSASVGAGSGASVTVHTGGRAPRRIACAHVVNCAGLYSDRVAQSFGFARDYTMLPFKGYYLYCRPEVRLRTHVYPVPNLATPFLGVHTTLSVDGTTKIGPTAIPGLWREHYTGLDNFSASECAEIVSTHARMALASVRGYARRALTTSSDAVDKGGGDFGEQFLRLAYEEVQKYRRQNLVHAAAQMIDGLAVADTAAYGRVGIRAQLYNKRAGKLEMDFRIEGDTRSTHVVNVISPGWTCSLPFAAHICDVMQQNMRSNT